MFAQSQDRRLGAFLLRQSLLMPERLQVFVSSGMADLKEERLAARDAIGELLVDPWLFEQDAEAQSRAVREAYLDAVAKSDLYVGIFWKKYGEYTIEEYQRA